MSHTLEIFLAIMFALFWVVAGAAALYFVGRWAAAQDAQEKWKLDELNDEYRELIRTSK